MTIRLDADRYFSLIDTDTERLLELGTRGRTQVVPCLDGWDVAEVLWHVAGVYEHKVRVMADNAWPDPWPPPEFQDRDEIEFLRAAKADLFEEFSRHDISEQTTTFGDPALDERDGTIAFWARRMALEIAVHRYDAELAHDDTTDVAEDLALDGIDEMLRLMLAGPWWDKGETAHPVDAAVAVESASHRWVCTLDARRVTITDDQTAPADATVSGDPGGVFLWLWGRRDDSRVTFSGDLDIVHEFRGRIVECSN